MLSKNWGFYFNGSGTDLGSGDLLRLLDFVREMERYQGSDLETNIQVHILALALVLARITILDRCLDIAKHEGIAFTCKSWMLLQVVFRTMDIPDLFASLFEMIADVIHSYSMDISLMSAFVQERLSNLRDRLLNLTLITPNMPFGRSGYKILLVIDEAQNLGKMEEFGTFLSEKIPPDDVRRTNDDSLYDYMRPILYPLVHGLYKMPADTNKFCVIPCGTGLSIFDLKWLEDSAPVTKGYSAQLGPFTDFQGWESPEHLKSYRELVRRSLPNDETRIIFDARVPDEAMPELFARLRGRFRPIVSAIELMIMPRNGIIEWRQAIEETENTLISTERRHQGKGNIVHDITKMISRVDRYKERYEKYRNIRDILYFFVLQHYLHGRPVILNTEEAPLVECSVGRIMDIANQTKTVLDEPFAVCAPVNYFLRDDPDFHRSIRDLFSLSTKPTVHGSTWEMTVMPSLIHVFHNHVLSDKALVSPEERCDELLLNILKAKARIVGVDPHMLGTDHRSMSLEEVLEAHVENGSRLRKDGKQVPAFYHPVETPPGPDISVQGHLGETKLQRFCTVIPKSYLSAVIAYPVELPGVEVSLPKPGSSKRNLAAPEEQPLQFIPLRIDQTNVYSFFPEARMKLLDLLKGVKRKLEQCSNDLEQESNDLE
ncbi:hypothetical protein BG005_009727 [Podila minutissima]|nr:hypothetical protein BG005_009727 [Podila minutissima]